MATRCLRLTPRQTFHKFPQTGSILPTSHPSENIKHNQAFKVLTLKASNSSSATTNVFFSNMTAIHRLNTFKSSATSNKACPLKKLTSAPKQYTPHDTTVIENMYTNDEVVSVLTVLKRAINRSHLGASHLCYGKFVAWATIVLASNKIPEALYCFDLLKNIKKWLSQKFITSFSFGLASDTRQVESNKKRRFSWGSKNATTKWTGLLMENVTSFTLDGSILMKYVR